MCIKSSAFQIAMMFLLRIHPMSLLTFNNVYEIYSQITAYAVLIIQHNASRCLELPHTSSQKPIHPKQISPPIIALPSTLIQFHSSVGESPKNVTLTQTYKHTYNNFFLHTFKYKIHTLYNSNS